MKVSYPAIYEGSIHTAVSAATTVTIHDKGDTRWGGEMYLPTMKVRASLRIKGMREWRLWGKDSKWGSFVGQIRVALNDMKAVRDCTHSLKSIFNATLISPTNEPHLEWRLWVIMLLLELSNCHPYFLLKRASLYSKPSFTHTLHMKWGFLFHRSM